MRKRTVKYTADTIFWYILYLLPLIYLFISMYSLFRSEQFMSEWFVYTNGAEETADEALRMLWAVMKECIDDFAYNGNIITTTFNRLFGESGVLPLFDQYITPRLISIVSYFVSVYLLHLAVDFLLFIPRLCHKWMNAFTRSEE